MSRPDGAGVLPAQGSLLVPSDPPSRGHGELNTGPGDPGHQRLPRACRLVCSARAVSPSGSRRALPRPPRHRDSFTQRLRNDSLTGQHLHLLSTCHELSLSVAGHSASCPLVPAFTVCHYELELGTHVHLQPGCFPELWCPSPPHLPVCPGPRVSVKLQSKHCRLCNHKVSSQAAHMEDA